MTHGPGARRTPGFVLLGCALLAGCTARMESGPASLETVLALRNQAMPPLATGRFDTAGTDIGRSVGVRLSVLRPPHGQSFADVLRDAVETELRAAGKLDPASPLRIDARLTESRIGENMSSGEASLGAQVTLQREGREIFAKSYRVDRRWPSDFIGALAIPDAFRNYNALYPLLARQILADPALIAAAGAPAEPQ